jgi:hypothetical protein
MRRTMKTLVSRGDPVTAGAPPMRATRWRLTMPLVLGLLAAAVASDVAGAKQHGQWQPAAPVAEMNSPATEGCPIESPDELSLYLMSTRGAGGDQDIWVATRGKVEDAFGEPQMLPAPVNSDANDFCPTPLRGSWLLFVSTRGGTDAYGTQACGGGDIYLTRRSPATGEWAAPRNLGCASQGGPNGPGTEFGPTVVDTDAGRLLLFSSGGDLGGNTQDIYVSLEQGDWTFGPREPVGALNSPHDDIMPNISKDGREIVFASNRPGGQGAFDIWYSTRANAVEAWGAPTNLGTAVNGAGPETRPSLSWDGSRLHFGRSGEVYVSSR